MNKQKKNKKGFSLIEVILALFVLVVGIIASITLVTNSVREVADSRDAIIAAGLAQEGTELVRNIRDNNASDVFHQTKRGVAVTRTIFDGFSAGECRVESFINGGNSQIWLRCNGGSVSQNQSRLRMEPISPGQNMYRHRGSGPHSDYSRKIIVDNVQTSSGEVTRVDVTSMVTWSGRDIPSTATDCTLRSKCVSDKTTLTNWIIHE